MKALLTIGLMTAALVGMSAESQARGPTLDELMAKWHKTGKVEKCVLTSDIEGTQVWDDQHILFKMHHGKAYLNTLPNACPRLGYDEAFAHETWSGWICAPEMIVPIDPMGSIPGRGCNLGQFEEVEKVPAAK